MKVGEDNPQAREEEGKLPFIKNGVQYISSWNSQNVWIGIPWESLHFRSTPVIVAVIALKDWCPCQPTHSGVASRRVPNLISQ